MMGPTVDAYIARDPNGVCRVMVKRAKYKHWFELGQHGPTDAIFDRHWRPGRCDGIRRLRTKQNFFAKFSEKCLEI